MMKKFVLLSVLAFMFLGFVGIAYAEDAATAVGYGSLEVYVSASSAESDPLSGALVRIWRDPLPPVTNLFKITGRYDAPGMAHFSLMSSSYNYTISKLGYIQATGRVPVRSPFTRLNVWLHHI